MTKPLDDLLKQLKDIQKQFVLSKDGEIIDCFCGCGFKIFVSPIINHPPGEGTCSVCFERIGRDDDEIKMMYKLRFIAHFHKKCEPGKIVELFPLPN